MQRRQWLAGVVGGVGIGGGAPQTAGAAALTPREWAGASGLDPAVAARVLDTGPALRVWRAGTRGTPSGITRGLTIQVPRGRALATVDQLDRLLRREHGPGHVVFVSQRRHGVGRDPEEVTVIRHADRFAPMRLLRTHGPAYALSPARVAAQVGAWDRRFGVDLLGAGPDWLQLRLRQLPAEPRRLAAEVYAFCPDAVGDGAAAVDTLAAELRLTRLLTLDWGRGTDRF